MKTLKQLSKKLSQYIFESVGDIRGYPDLDLLTINNVKEWLTQKRQEDPYANYKDWGGSEAKGVYNRLLEELNHLSEGENHE